MNATAGLAVHVATVAVLGTALALALFGQFDVDDAVVAVLVAGFCGAVLGCTGAIRSNP